MAAGSWLGPAPVLRGPLTGSLDGLLGFPARPTVSPAARKASILNSISETWGDNRHTSLGVPISASEYWKSSWP